MTAEDLEEDAVEDPSQAEMERMLLENLSSSDEEGEEPPKKRGKRSVTTISLIRGPSPLAFLTACIHTWAAFCFLLYCIKFHGYCFTKQAVQCKGRL